MESVLVPVSQRTVTMMTSAPAAIAAFEATVAGFVAASVVPDFVADVAADGFPAGVFAVEFVCKAASLAAFCCRCKLLN